MCGLYRLWHSADYNDEKWLSVRDLSADDAQMRCRKLISKRYISDGFCTSVRPVTERVCGGYCLPVNVLPHYAEYIKVWARSELESWCCVERHRRTRHVKLRCDNGTVRRYPLRVVSGCRCQRASRLHNQSRVSVTVTRGRTASCRHGRKHRQHRHRTSRRRITPT